MPYIHIDHLQYSIWANGKIADTMEEISDEIFYTEVKSSYPSIAKTLLHIWDAEYLWLHRMQGESLSDFPSTYFTGNKEALLSGFRQSSKDFLDYINAQPDGYIYQTFSYKNIAGEDFQNTIDEILYHVVNHGAFHRGQIVTILRELGATKLPQTDLIFYLRA